MGLFSVLRRQPVPSNHRGYPPHCHLPLIVGLVSLIVAAPGAGAQTGTPPAGRDGSASAECTVEPRAEDDLRALFREVAATPLPNDLAASPGSAVPPTGAPADEQTVAEINATWGQYLACLASGDQARMFALLSDDMVRRQFTVDLAFGVTEDALFAYLAATPVPLSSDQAVPFVPLADVRVLGDGRVAAMAPGEQGREDVRIFVKDGDRWVLDDWFELP